MFLFPDGVVCADLLYVPVSTQRIPPARLTKSAYYQNKSAAKQVNLKGTTRLLLSAETLYSSKTTFCRERQTGEAT
jgi:hypothetical protein